MLSFSQYIKSPSKIVLGFLTHFPYLFSDKISLKIQYRLKLGRKLDLSNPLRYTEKLQWLKLYDRKPLYTTMVDKIAVKEYVANLIGKKYIIPTLGVWNHFDEIDFDTLPNKFVLKTNHGGGGDAVVFCKDKTCFDKERARKVMENSLAYSIYPVSREWPYKNVVPKILAEQFLDNKVEKSVDAVSEKDNGIRDYKFYCFNGIPRVLLIASNRFTTHNFNYFDMDFRPLPITSVDGDPIEYGLIKKPESFEEMKAVACRLAKDLTHIRVDLYEVNGDVFFGELTFFDSSGFDNLNSDEIDLEWGSWMALPKK